MNAVKGFVVVATIVATVVSLGACRKEVGGESLKLGASDVAVSIVR